MRPWILSGDGFEGFSVWFSDVHGECQSYVSHIPLCICVYVCSIGVQIDICVKKKIGGVKTTSVSK